MTQKPSDGFWGRLAQRTRPAGSLRTIENPQTVVRAITGGLWAAVAFAAAFALALFALDELVLGWVTLGLAVAYLASWWVYVLTGSLVSAATFVVLASVANEVALHVGLGGHANSGAYLMWGVTGTLTVALMVGRRAAVAVAIVYVALAIGLGFMEDTLSSSRPPPAEALSTTLFVVTFTGNIILVTGLLVYVLGRLAYERERGENLLLNILPAPVAAELKEFGRAEARKLDSISVLFADVVGFTPWSAEVDADELVAELNEVFSQFDQLTQKHRCEKIRTIGDAYMVAAGVPVPRDDHADALVALALDMLEQSAPGQFRFRVGICSGPAVAGVIGTSKFQYDLWGDTINTASRMESHGEPGRIQVCESTYKLIKPNFDCTPRGPIKIKGKGIQKTWYVNGRKVEA